MRRHQGALRLSLVRLSVLVCFAGTVACSGARDESSSSEPDGGAAPDASTATEQDAGPGDAGSTAASDGGADSGPAPISDGGADSGPTPVTDGGTDAGPVPVIDGGPDAGPVPVIDGGPDAGPRPGSDAGPVAGITGAQVGVGTTLAGCQMFPNDNAWNVEIDGPDVVVTHAYDSELPQTAKAHPDFGDYTLNHYGIPYSVVDAGQPDVPTTFTLWADQSDPGPGNWVGTDPVTANAAVGVTAYPFFLGMPIEGDPSPGGTPGNLPGDQHALVLQQGPSGCHTYEAWNCVEPTTPAFECANGAVFDLTSNALRPAGWTSAELAGMSILAGLVKYDEVASGTITHAIRVTFNHTQSGYIAPATHAASPGSPSAAGPVGSAYPPMGLRIRLKASVTISGQGYQPQSVVIMTAMKKYGLIVADIGSDWFFSGDSDDRWDTMVPSQMDTLIDVMTGDFRHLTGADFEVVYTGAPVDTGL